MKGPLAAPGQVARPLSTSETRRAFIERLAKTSAVPLVLPLLFSGARTAVAYV